MPYLDHFVQNATLDSSTIIPVDGSYARLRRAQWAESWSQGDPYATSGVITFNNYAGWALRLPPYTFEPIVRFSEQDLKLYSQFGLWTDWAAVAGVISIQHSVEFQAFHEEVRVNRDTGVGTSEVSRSVTWNLRADDTIEFRVHLPSNANGLAVILQSGAGSARYEEFSPLANDWNLILVEIDQPTSTAGPWDPTAVDTVAVEVAFADAVAAYFVIGSALLDRTAQVGGEIRWQVSTDNGVTWLGWNGASWAAGVYCHSHWVERRLSLLSPSTAMQWRARCRLTPSENRRVTPEVYGVICGLDFDSYLHTENDLKRSLRRYLANIDIRLRAVSEGNGTASLTLLTHFNNPTVEHVYSGDVTAVDTTTDLFSVQGATTEVPEGYSTAITLTGALVSGQRAIIHYTANPPVKIAADRFLIEAAVPEIDLSFPTHDQRDREGISTDIFTNRSLGYVWVGTSVVRDTYDWEMYCTANSAAMLGGMSEAVRRALESGFASDGTGFLWFVGDMLPADIESEHGSGLHVRRIAADCIGARWQDLQLTQVRQVRTILPNVRMLPKKGYVNGV